MTKEQYIKIRASWKQYIKDGKHKKYKIPSSDYTKIIRNENGKFLDFGSTGYSWHSDLQSYHHLLYALLRKKDLHKSFKDNLKFTTIKKQLRAIVDNCENEYKKDHINKFVNLLLVPFGEEFSFELMKDLLKEL